MAAKKENVAREYVDINNNSIMMYQPQVEPLPTVGRVINRPKPVKKYQDELSWRWNPFAYMFALSTTGTLGMYGAGIYFGVKQQHDMLEKVLHHKCTFQNTAIFTLAFAIYYYHAQKKALEKIEKEKQKY